MVHKSPLFKARPIMLSFFTPLPPISGHARDSLFSPQNVVLYPPWRQPSFRLPAVFLRPLLCTNSNGGRHLIIPTDSWPDFVHAQITKVV